MKSANGHFPWVFVARRMAILQRRNPSRANSSPLTYASVAAIFIALFEKAENLLGFACIFAILP